MRLSLTLPHPPLFIYIYVLLSYFGPAVLHPLPTFPSHYKSDLRKEQHSGLTLISQHLLGLMHRVQVSLVREMLHKILNTYIFHCLPPITYPIYQTDKLHLSTVCYLSCDRVPSSPDRDPASFDGQLHLVRGHRFSQ